jgi:hypothetical protein
MLVLGAAGLDAAATILLAKSEAAKTNDMIDVVHFVQTDLKLNFSCCHAEITQQLMSENEMKFMTSPSVWNGQFS